MNTSIMDADNKKWKPDKLYILHELLTERQPATL